ncbi:unnamed protein product, partial [Symbiodinium sp. CCMP2456]
ALLQEIQPLVPRLQSGGAKSEVLRRANASTDADETTDHIAPFAAIGWFSGDATDRLSSGSSVAGCVFRILSSRLFTQEGCRFCVFPELFLFFFLFIFLVGCLFVFSAGQASSLSDKDTTQGLATFRVQKHWKCLDSLPLFVDQDTGSYGRVNIVLPRPSRLYAPLQRENRVACGRAPRDEVPS